MKNSNFNKWEISIMIGVVVTIIWCAASPGLTTQWWTAAFAPLCDGLFTSELGSGDVVLRSKLWELLSGLWT
ncbi:MAG: hypothetical protein J5449_11120 [Oscillospiraceae bacterium]|nr:hypothetical protein [Oscillospiraceae bacterium]